jgi:Family of unknown function (DUF6056)
VLLGACAVVLAVPLVVFAISGWFSRYASDDYCTAGIVLERGLVGAQEYWYTTWSGRFAFFGLVSGIELLGDWSVQVMPALGLVGGVAVGTWALLPIAAGWRHPRLAPLVLAELVVFAIFASVPNLGQSLFWETGVLTYTLPLLLLLVFGGWLARVLVCKTAVTVPGLVGCALLMCIAGGLSETNLAVQAMALGLALVGVVAARRGDAAALVAAALVGTAVAAIILAAAPGNGERVTRSDYPGAQLANLLLAARASLSLLIAFARRFEAEFRPVFLATGLIGFGVGVCVNPQAAGQCDMRGNVLRSALAAAVVVLSAAVLVWSSFFPSYWVLGFDPPARIELVAQSFIVCAVAALGFSVGRVAARLAAAVQFERALRAVASVVALLALAAPLSIALAQLGHIPDAQRYALMWDDNDHTLRQAHESGTADVAVVPPLPQWWGWDWVGPRTDDFPNACVARYYGLAAVRSGPVSASAP